MRVAMLSTIDNPYDPFDNFREWFAFDEMKGYHTTSYLGRLIHSSFEMSETDQALQVEFAVDEAVEENILGIYIKLVREVPDPE